MELEKLIVGLTGGVASGKSTATEILKKKNLYAINADEIVHKLYETKFFLRLRLILNFGFKILDENLSINRKKLAEIVFNDHKKLKKLNSIVWPSAVKYIKSDIKNRSGIIILEIPMLFESGSKITNYNVLITCSLENQISRLVKRGQTYEESIKRINSQLDQREKEELADYIIENNSTTESLKGKVEDLYSILINLYYS
ncbi:dephospho-CoA kinase [Candidatus Woesearchaeota archaeon]|nr:dephospho-CoA kinase [Candidatus Woesearchaeota archaeon]